jgi:hypothetical protein
MSSARSSGAGPGGRGGVQRGDDVAGQRIRQPLRLDASALGQAGVGRTAAGDRVDAHRQGVTHQHDLHADGR